MGTKNQDIETNIPANEEKGDNPKQNFGLKRSQFNEMVNSFLAGNENLLEAIYSNHFKDCIHYLMKNFNIQYDIAYDATMDTMVEFRRLIIEEKIGYGNLRFLFTKIAGQIYLRNVKKESKLKDVMVFNDEADDYYEEASHNLKKVWNDLSEEDRQLLEKHYYFDIPLIKIAEMQNRTDVALRKQKQRAIEKLRSCITKIN